jgi:hypothetical protein
MSNVTTWLRQLEAYVQEELGAQGRLTGLLETQERALLSHERDALTSASEALQAEIAGSAARARRRDELVGQLARAWGVDASALTLASIARRSGVDGERLTRQRAELQRASQRVQKLARRANSAARLHSRLSGDIVRACLAAGGEADVDAGGALVNAEA